MKKISVIINVTFVSSIVLQKIVRGAKGVHALCTLCTARDTVLKSHQIA